MGFLRVPNLAPWLIFNVNILGVRAELSLISFAGSDSILYLGREGIKEREEGKRGGGGRLFEGRLLFEEMRYLLLTITASCLLNMLSIAKRKGKEMKLGPYGSLGPFYRKNHWHRIYASGENKLCLWPGPLFNRICITIMPQTVFIYELKTMVNNSAMHAYKNKEKQRLNHKQK